MKVELLVNLKLGDGRMVSAGTVFSDREAPIPDFVLRRLARNQAKIIEHTPAPVKKPETISDSVSNKVSEVVKESPKIAKKDSVKKVIRK